MSETTTTTTHAPEVLPQQHLRSIFFYKIIQGHKIKWELKIDNQMVIVEEGPAVLHQFNSAIVGQPPVPVNVGEEAAKIFPVSPMDNYRRILDERGIKYTTSERGQIIVSDVPVKEKMTMQFFDLNAPAPAGDGIAELREKYKNEIEESGGTAGCSSCKLNTIQRKYREILKTKLPNG
jgi:hypothetical protein